MEPVELIGRGSFKLAVVNGDVPANPLDHVDLPTIEKPDLHIPTATAVSEILAATDEAYRAPLRVQAGTGMRAGEVPALKWDDVFTDDDGAHPGCAMDGVAHLHVAGTMTKVDGRLTVLAPKTESGRRAVALSVFVVRTLESHRAEQDARRVALDEGWNPAGWVFDDGRGGPQDPGHIGDAFRRARKASGHEGVRAHDLRHHYATAMLAATGGDVATVSQALGHSTASFTIDRYIHLTADAGRKMADAADAALGEALGGA